MRNRIVFHDVVKFMLDDKINHQLLIQTRPDVDGRGEFTNLSLYPLEDQINYTGDEVPETGMSGSVKQLIDIHGVEKVSIGYIFNENSWVIFIDSFDVSWDESGKIERYISNTTTQIVLHMRGIDNLTPNGLTYAERKIKQHEPEKFKEIERHAREYVEEIHEIEKDGKLYDFDVEEEVKHQRAEWCADRYRMYYQ